MPITRCMNCNGSGQIMGGGMMMKNCDNCYGKGKISDGKVTLSDIKDTPQYREAVDNIRCLNPTISRADAEKLFDDEFDKEDKPVVIRKKPGPKKRIEVESQL